MNKRFLYVLAFALLFSIAASAVLYRLIASRISQAAKAPTTRVVAAARNLEIGTLLKDSDVRFVDWTGEAPKGSYTKPEDVVGRGVNEPIYDGEPLLDGRLAAKGAGGGLAATIPPGMRAVAVRVNEVAGVSGFVGPGKRVDVLIAGNPPGPSAQQTGTMTKTILQNIEVLSAGSNIQRDAEGKPVTVPVVNLLVTPEQAETLSLAASETKIQLVLRNPLDKEVAKTPGTAVANLFTGQSGLPAPPVRPAERKPRPVTAAKASAPIQPAAPAPPAPQAAKVVVPIIIEVIHGTKKTEAKFQPTEEARQ